MCGRVRVSTPFKKQKDGRSFHPMSALGAIAVAAANARLSSLDTNNNNNNSAEITIHYCTAKRLLENFAWRCVKLAFGNSSSPSPPGPPLGIEIVVPLVSALLERERSQLPVDERRCFFCQDTIALADEYQTYLYRAFEANVHLVVMAHCCRKPSCQGETQAWLKTVRKKPLGSHHRCAQCGASDADADSKFLACGLCLMVNYCSEACQRAHWPSHRHFCKIFLKE